MNWNERLRDELIEHQADLMRLAAATAAERARYLAQTEPQIKALIAAADIAGGQWAELERLRAEVAELRQRAWQEVRQSIDADMSALAIQEGQALAAAYVSASAGAIRPAPVSTDMLGAIVESRPFEGRLLREWASKMEADDIGRIQSVIQLGMTSGMGPRQIAARAASAAGVARRDIEAVVRTATNHIAAQAQAEFVAANDFIAREMYVATLDSRTTLICASNDGKVFAVGEGPVPPLHYQCRSRRIGWIDGAVLGDRPAVGTSERQAREAYAELSGRKPPYAEFRRRWYREAAGSVPAATTYEQWLKSRPAALQDAILGPTRGRLFRAGNLSLDRFVARSGDTITLDDLSRKYARAFERAGVDPDTYR